MPRRPLCLRSSDALASSDRQRFGTHSRTQTRSALHSAVAFGCIKDSCARCRRATQPRPFSFPISHLQVSLRSISATRVRADILFGAKTTDSPGLLNGSLKHPAAHAFPMLPSGDLKEWPHMMTFGPSRASQHVLRRACLRCTEVVCPSAHSAGTVEFIIGSYGLPS